MRGVYNIYVSQRVILVIRPAVSNINTTLDVSILLTPELARWILNHESVNVDIRILACWQNLWVVELAVRRAGVQCRRRCPHRPVGRGCVAGDDSVAGPLQDTTHHYLLMALINIVLYIKLLSH